MLQTDLLIQKNTDLRKINYCKATAEIKSSYLSVTLLAIMTNIYISPIPMMTKSHFLTPLSNLTDLTDI